MFDLAAYFSPLTTDIEQVQKSVQILNYSASFLSQYPNYNLMQDEFFSANLDAHRISAIIGLGKVFDGSSDAHSLSHLIHWLHENRLLFSKESCISRKTSKGIPRTEAERYVGAFSGIDDDAIKAISKAKTKLVGTYNQKVRDLRNQAFAHRLNNITAQGVEYKVMEELADGALGIFDDIFNAYYKARLFSFKSQPYPSSRTLNEFLEKFFRPYRFEPYHA